MVDPAEAAVEIPEDATTVQRRNVEIVKEYAQRPRTDKPRVVRLRFLASPVELRGDGRVQEMVISRNRLEPGPDGVAARRADG